MAAGWVTGQPHNLTFLFISGLAFEIAEGGFLDIDIKIYNPEGKTIHEGERESNGRYTFPASMDGVYTYCFSNKMSTMTPKIVMFTMEVGDDTKSEHHAGNGEEGEQGMEEIDCRCCCLPVKQ